MVKTIFQGSPSKIRLEGFDRNLLEVQLTFRDQKVEYELRKAKKSQWLRQKLGEGYNDHIRDLESRKKRSLLFEDEEGLWTYSGLAQKLARVFNATILPSAVVYPESKLIPWAKKPPSGRPYQNEAVEALLQHRHAGVSIGTGLGKSWIAQAIIKDLGLKTVVMAPSKSIARQLYADFQEHLGKNRVGLFGDGRKDYKKQFVVGIAGSLTRVKPGTPEWEELSQAQVFVSDESHQTPAETLNHVCFGLLANAPYRFFFSGTQIRNDGLGLLLEAITGPIVYEMSVRDGVDQGWLAKPIFTMIRTSSPSAYTSKDANAMTRRHLYYNRNVNQLAADIANKSIEISKRPTLILIEEIEQFAHLLPYLRHEPLFAHGSLTKEQAAKIPAQYHGSNPNDLVARFNAGHQLLIGTSCVATGTDIKAVQHVIYLMGQKSEIKVKQAVGRSTRLFGDKKDCYFTDFSVDNIDILSRHAAARANIYDDIYGPVREVTV